MSTPSNARKTTEQGRALLNHPAGLRRRHKPTDDHKVRFLGPYKGPAKEDEKEETGRPAWMQDATFLPKRPPGR